MEKTRKPLHFSKTVALSGSGQRPRPGAVNRRPRLLPAERLGTERDRGDRRWQESGEPEEAALEAPAGRIRLEPLIREWLLDLPVMGRSPRTIDWSRQKKRWYLEQGAAQSPAQPTTTAAKRHPADRTQRRAADAPGGPQDRADASRTAAGGASAARGALRIRPSQRNLPPIAVTTR